MFISIPPRQVSRGESLSGDGGGLERGRGHVDVDGVLSVIAMLPVRPWTP
jgi:hypothetical protein